MKKFITVFTLTLASGIASADGFHPWANRTAPEIDSLTVSEATPFNGFAPWRDQITIEDVNDNIDVAQSYDIGFRPWS